MGSVVQMRAASQDVRSHKPAARNQFPCDLYAIIDAQGHLSLDEAALRGMGMQAIGAMLNASILLTAQLSMLIQQTI